MLDVDNRLIVPCMHELVVVVTSGDVVHSWVVLGLGIKLDCIPGRLNQGVIRILIPGVYYGQCSELCGVMHSFIPIVVEGLV